MSSIIREEVSAVRRAGWALNKKPKTIVQYTSTYDLELITKTLQNPRSESAFRKLVVEPQKNSVNILIDRTLDE